MFTANTSHRLRSLTILSDQFLADLFTAINMELTPYFSSNEIISTSERDSWGPTDLTRLNKELAGFHEYMTSRKAQMRKYLASETLDDQN